MKKFYHFSSCFKRVESADVVKETQHFITIRHKIPSGFTDCREKKLSDYHRWFPSIEEALNDATLINSKKMANAYTSYDKKCEDFQEVRKIIKALRGTNETTPDS